MSELIRGRYEPQEVRGRGGEGQVLRAIDRQHGRQVAIKVRRLASEAERSAVLTEARTLLAVRPHPALPLVREDFFDDDRYFLVMDWIDGETLEEVLEERGTPGLPYSTVLGFLETVCDALDHMHSHDPPIVHSDVKPANIILTPEGSTVLVDFGIARAANAEGQAAGSRSYAAPEIALGVPVTAAADVFGLAATAVALITGFPPRGLRPDWTGVPRAAVDSLDEAVGRALHPDPSRRPASPREFLDRIRAFDRPLPEGIVTFLFTDVEGSTHLWERYSAVMRSSLARHDRMIRAAVEDHGGTLVKSRGEGDSHFAVFDRATDGVAAACAAQLSLGREPWPDETPMRVRMALHTGEAELRHGEFYGAEVNRCARLRSIGWGGQILLSQATADLVGDLPAGGTSLLDLGSHGLKDLSRPEHVYQLVHPDISRDFPPLRSLTTLPHNLPTQLTSFVGREAEIAEFRGLLAEERLITLTGAAGCGKTRLAVQVGAESLESFPDGVWFIDLSGTLDPSLVWKAIARVVGPRDAPDQELDAAVIDHLQSSRALLVLDNCEHVVGECASAAERLLTACPGLRIIATSREVFGITAESVRKLSSLGVPARDAGTAEIEQSEAVRLFVERASRARQDFALNDDNAGAVADITRSLDGIPLAIELAAARAAMLKPRQIAERLQDRFRLLTGGSRTAIPRQQTLRAAVDWSYNLLPPAQQMLLARLSVFVGGMDLDAAEAVCSGSGIEPVEVLDLLTQLAAKSLLVVDEDAPEPRFRLLETIRQYAREKLEGSGTTEDLRTAHRDWYLRVVEDAEPFGEERRHWLERLQTDHDNLRAALASSLEADDASPSLRMAGALAGFWLDRGHFVEGRGWLERALDASPATDEAVRAKAMSGLAGILRELGEYARAGALLEASRDIAEKIEDEAGMCLRSIELGSLAYLQGQYDHAVEMTRPALERGHRLGDLRVVCRALTVLAEVARDRGEYSDAADLLERGLAAAREAEEPGAVADVTAKLGLVAWERGDLAMAAARYEEALPLVQEHQNRARVAILLSNLAGVAYVRGALGEARVRYEEALALATELGHKRGVASILGNLGGIAEAEGDFDTAHLLHEKSLALSRELGDARGIAHELRELGEIIREQGDLTGARDLLHEALAMARAAGERADAGQVLTALSKTARDAGDLDNAEAHGLEALTIAAELDIPWQISAAKDALGRAECARGNIAEGLAHFCESLAILRAQGERYAVPGLLEDIAGALVASGKPNMGARLAGAAAALREAGGTMPAPRSMRLRERLVAALDPELMREAWAAGGHLGFDQAVDEALTAETA